MRESYRKNKQYLYDNLSENHVFIITFMDTNEWKTADLEFKMQQILQKFIKTAQQKDSKQI